MLMVSIAGGVLGSLTAMPIWRLMALLSAFTNSNSTDTVLIDAVVICGVPRATSKDAVPSGFGMVDVRSRTGVVPSICQTCTGFEGERSPQLRASAPPDGRKIAPSSPTVPTPSAGPSAMFTPPTFMVTRLFSMTDSIWQGAPPQFAATSPGATGAVMVGGVATVMRLVPVITGAAMLVAVMVVVPAPVAVTMPFVTVATTGLLVDQVTPRFTFPRAFTVAVSSMDSPRMIVALLGRIETLDTPLAGALGMPPHALSIATAARREIFRSKPLGRRHDFLTTCNGMCLIITPSTCFVVIVALVVRCHFP